MVESLQISHNCPPGDPQHPGAPLWRFVGRTMVLELCKLQAKLQVLMDFFWKESL